MTGQKNFLTVPGFTLAELIVVIAILAVLATVGLLALSGYRQDAKDAVVKTNVRSVYAAIAAESTALQKSARCFIVHSPTHTLTGGAVVMFDGGVADALVGGPCGTPGTNYSAGNPDYRALRLDPEKFRISLLSSPRLAASAMGWLGASAEEEYVADPTLLLVGAADLTDESGTKPRTRSFVQVAAVLSSDTAYVAGDFPSGDVDGGAVAGLIKDAAYSESSTGALVDGASTGAPAPCAEGEVSGYPVPALSSGEQAQVRKPITNGEGVATARCSYGTVRIENETASCETDYVPANPVPSCVRDNCSGTFPANAVSNETTPGGTGNWTYNEAAGTCRFKCAAGFTWDGSACKADCAVSAASAGTYQGLSYGIAANLPLAHGATATATGTYVFGTDPANGELQVSFSYSCSEGTATPTPTEIGGSCYGGGYLWNNSWSAPNCGCAAGYTPQGGVCVKICQFDDPNSKFDSCVFGS